MNPSKSSNVTSDTHNRHTEELQSRENETTNLVLTVDVLADANPTFPPAALLNQMPPITRFW